jgi:hypothetical protein
LLLAALVHTTARQTTNPGAVRASLLQVSVVRYHFKENCTEAKYATVLAAFNAWQPWKLSKEHALAEIQCGYDNLRVQVKRVYSTSQQSLQRTAAV